MDLALTAELSLIGLQWKANELIWCGVLYSADECIIYNVADRIGIWVTKCRVTRGNFPCNLQRNGVALQVARKTSSCDAPCLQLVSQRKIALQVAEKVEAASTFRNVTRQVAACDTPHCNLSRNFCEKEPITKRHNQNAADIFKYSAGA